MAGERDLKQLVRDRLDGRRNTDARKMAQDALPPEREQNPRRMKAEPSHHDREGGQADDAPGKHRCHRNALHAEARQPEQAPHKQDVEDDVEPDDGDRDAEGGNREIVTAQNENCY